MLFDPKVIKSNSYYFIEIYNLCLDHFSIRREVQILKRLRATAEGGRGCGGGGGRGVYRWHCLA